MQKMPVRLTVVGDLERPDHAHLPAENKCYFWGEYTPYEFTDGKKWNFSATNQLISNFKKKLDRQGYSDWQYKQQAIDLVARNFAQFWKWDNLHNNHRVMVVPIPPSKSRADKEYDCRMTTMLQGIAKHSGIPIDIRDCLSFSGICGTSHVSTHRATPDELYDDLMFDKEIGQPQQVPGLIFLFDDLLTTGAHFLAASKKLNDHFPSIDIIGNFIGRRIIANPFANIDDFDDLTL